MAEKTKSTKKFLCVGPRDGWPGKMHKTVGGAEAFIAKAARFGLQTDRKVFEFDSSQKPEVVPMEDGTVKLSYILKPV